jgi:hypothetical protein
LVLRLNIGGSIVKRGRVRNFSDRVGALQTP